MKSEKSVVMEGRWKRNIIMSSFCALHDVTGRSWMLSNSATFARDHLFSVLAAFIRFQSETHVSSSRRLGQRQPLYTVSDLMSGFLQQLCMPVTGFRTLSGDLSTLSQVQDLDHPATSCNSRVSLQLPSFFYSLGRFVRPDPVSDKRSPKCAGSCK